MGAKASRNKTSWARGLGKPEEENRPRGVYIMSFPRDKGRVNFTIMSPILP